MWLSGQRLTFLILGVVFDSPAKCFYLGNPNVSAGVGRNDTVMSENFFRYSSNRTITVFGGPLSASKNIAQKVSERELTLNFEDQKVTPEPLNRMCMLAQLLSKSLSHQNPRTFHSHLRLSLMHGNTFWF